MKMAVFWVVATRLHGATTQKTAICVLTAVRTSNPTNRIYGFQYSLLDLLAIDIFLIQH
jgi:hypothetical protein